MSKQVEPVTAWAAVDSFGLIYPHTARRNREDAEGQAADSCRKRGESREDGLANFLASGYRLVRVEIRVKEEG